MEMVATRVFNDNYESFLDDNIRFIVNEGGSRSSKTFSLCQLLIILALRKSTFITIARATLKSIKSSVLRDVLGILNDYELSYDFNKTDHIISFNNGSVIEFIGCDDGDKLRGSKRDILYLNEANTISYDAYKQLVMRTSEKVFMDYNPSSANHYIYSEIIPNPKSTLIKSTYLDNPFLDQNIIDEIEEFKNTSPDYWRIFGLGIRGLSSENIFQKYTLVDRIPNDFEYIASGLDFGFINSQTALVNLYTHEKSNTILLEECLYRRGMFAKDISKEIKNVEINKGHRLQIYADSEDPRMISELKQFGHKIKPVKKASVLTGINKLLSYRLLLKGEHFEEEVLGYKWCVDKNNDILNVPDKVKYDPHLFDAARYVVDMTLHNNKKLKLKIL